MTADQIERWLVSKVAAIAGTTEDQVDRTRPLTSQGLDSLAVFGLTGDLAEWLGRDLPALLVWEFPSIDVLADYLESASEDTTPITPAGRDRPLPLSLSQERLWRHSRLNTAGDYNFLIRHWILRGPLDVELLRRSYAELVRRHDILRTTFIEIDGQPFQCVHPTANFVFSVTDVSADGDPPAAIQRVADAHFSAGMSLEHGPLLRLALVKVAEHEHRLLLTLHHLLFDAQSLRVLFGEVSLFYQALRREGALPALDPPVHIADFAAWQREALRPDGSRYQALVSWWKDHWREPIPGPFNLPARRTDGAIVPPTAPPESRPTWKMPAAIHERVQALADAEGTTLFVVLLAAFQVLLCRLTSRDELILGTYVSDRTRVVLRRTIGMFANLLAIRADLTGRPSLVEVVRRVRETMQQATRHQELPLEMLADELAREGRAAPWVQVIFQQIRVMERPIPLDGIETMAVPVERRSWGLTMSVFQLTSSVDVHVAWDPNVYDRAGLVTMLEEYEAVVDAMVSRPTEAALPEWAVSAESPSP